jgi:hypothetical protein
MEPPVLKAAPCSHLRHLRLSCIPWTGLARFNPPAPSRHLPRKVAEVAAQRLLGN